MIRKKESYNMSQAHHRYLIEVDSKLLIYVADAVSTFIRYLDLWSQKNVPAYHQVFVLFADTT